MSSSTLPFTKKELQHDRICSSVVATWASCSISPCMSSVCKERKRRKTATKRGRRNKGCHCFVTKLLLFITPLMLQIYGCAYVYIFVCTYFERSSYDAVERKTDSCRCSGIDRAEREIENREMVS